MKKILVIGSGGREHALGWKLGQSESVSTVFYAPGNAGTEEEGVNVNLDLNRVDLYPLLKDFVDENAIDMVVVGPEGPLADGLVDYLNAAGYDRVFGPTKAAAQLEADKFFSSDVMKELHIPQARSVKCFSTEDAVHAIKEHTTEQGIVIKARYLTAGKGVSVCATKQEALEEIVDHADRFGPEVLIAERLYGPEFCVFGVVDKNQGVPVTYSFQDHKRLKDNDEGPNTGGMGAYGPAPIAPPAIVHDVAQNIMNPVVQYLNFKGAPYQGFFYTNMMMTEEGPKVIEFNVRFGDPECQPAMMLLEGDLYEALDLALDGKVEQADLSVKHGAACCVVLASQGYPGEYKKGLPITGIAAANDVEGVKVFHSGTVRNDRGVCTNGGRVLGVTAYAEDIVIAQRSAYDAVNKIHIEGGSHYRKDIAHAALGR